MKRMKSCLALMLALAMIVGGLAGLAEAAGGTPVLTLMVYITGSDLESLGGAATGDITEMLRSGVDTGKVNVILCAGGSKLWQNGFPNDVVSICRLDRRRLRPLTNLGKASMGAPETLTGFLNYSVENYPADRYALILWDHGGGPMNGVCFDELFSKADRHDSLDLNELGQALKESPFSSENPLEWIGFDACLMASVETACACAPYARYMIASQETEPGTGWNYAFLGGLDGSLAGDAAGARIVESYAGAAGGASGQMLTLSCVDLSRVAGVERAMDDLFAHLDDMLSPEHFSDISNGRRDAKSFGRASTGSEYDLVDLYSLSEQYSDAQPERAAAVRSALEEAVVCVAGNQANSHGLSVYYPYFNKDYFNNGWKQLYGTWAFARGYYDFLMDYAKVWLGEQMADWSNMRGTARDPDALAQEITLPLTPEQVAHFAFAQVFILGKMPYVNWFYYKVDEIDDVTLDDEGVLHADYNYKALYAVDGDGEPLCDAIPYRIVDGYYLIRSNLTDKTWNEYRDEWYSDRGFSLNEEASIDVRKVFLQCAMNEAGDGLDVVGIIDQGEGIDGMLYEGDGLYTGKQTLSADMEGWNYVWFFHFPRELTRDDDGGLESFESWPNPNDNDSLTLEWDEIDNTEPWSLKFLEQQYAGRDLYAQYIVHDTQGNLTGSNLIPVANPTHEQVVTEPRVLYDSEKFELTLTGIDLARARFNDGLYLRLKLKDKRKEVTPFDLRIRDVMLNRCRLDDAYSPMPALDEGGEVVYALNIPTKDMPANLEERVERIAFDFRVFENDGSYDDIEVIPVALDVDIDISDVHEYVPLDEALAEAQAGDMLYRLMSLRQEDDCLMLSVYAENRSDAPVDDNWRSNALVDGCEWASSVEGAWFELPEDSWGLEKVRLYTTSPAVGSSVNRDDTPQYSYPAYWGTPVIHSIEFTDWNNEPVRFELSEPFALSGMEGVVAAQSAEAEALTLLDAEDFRIELTGFELRPDGLRLTVDLSNRTDGEMGVMSQSASVNGEEVDRELRSMDGWLTSFFSEETLSAHSRSRFTCVLKPEAATAAERGIETFALRFQYRPEGEEMWRYTTEAELGFAGGAVAPGGEGEAALRLADVVLLSPCEPLENAPVDPKTLVDVSWSLPRDAADYAVTLRAPLDEARQADFAGAEAKLIWKQPREQAGEYGLQYVAELYAPVTLSDGMLACDFGGLLLRCGDCSHPSVQHIISGEDGEALYSLRGLRLYTDSADMYSNDPYFTQLDVRLDAAERRAWVESAALDPGIGSAERPCLLEYLALVYEYADGEGSALENTGSLMGESYQLTDGVVPMSVCPAEDFDLWVVFTVTNADGSVYTVARPYAEACEGAR